MKTASVSEIKRELGERSPQELKETILRLARFKKENKELLTYALFESVDENAYVESVKQEMNSMFEEINTASYYYIKKSVRKILRHTKTRIRYSLDKQTEVELLLWFCIKLANFKPSIRNSLALENILLKQLQGIRKTMPKLHEDLRYDYEKILKNIKY
ncbi:MAG: hypothetical protein C0595_00315 [Marinilabiliales bacterium]|nr:MAG: hypothetical protein C0595_00315 [Marinilabiliales bacterium]